MLSGLPELQQLDRWATKPKRFTSRVLVDVLCGKDLLPVYAFSVGGGDPTLPSVMLVGGVHGIERIGTQLILAFMESLQQRLDWDKEFVNLIQQINLHIVPLLNPGGMLLQTRANPAGVDLMRNAPIDARGKVPPLLGGQRITRWLPWYRGESQADMEPEASALCDWVMDIVNQSRFSLSLDCHSGFGHRDRIWFPYACTPDPFDDIDQMFALRLLFRRTHPTYSFYRIEPQSMQYTTHGDLWDHLYTTTQQSRGGPYLPLTLEMGSWLWVKKNPRQLFNGLGIFNPVIPHRHERVLRRHQCFLEFLVRAAAAHDNWLPRDSERRDWVHQAIEHWY